MKSIHFILILVQNDPELFQNTFSGPPRTRKPKKTRTKTAKPKVKETTRTRENQKAEEKGKDQEALTKKNLNGGEF